MYLPCQLYLQKGKGEVHTIPLPGCCHGAHPDTNTPATPAALAMESKKRKISSGGADSCLNANTFERKQLRERNYENPSKERRVGARADKPCGSPSGTVPASSPAKAETGFQERFANSTHLSHP